MKLREYQEESVKAILNSFDTPFDGDRQKRIMYQLPTGGGKTVVTNAINNKMMKNGTFSVTIAHRRELLYQAADKYGKAFDLECGFVLSGQKLRKDLQMQIGSVQTLSSWIKREKDIKWLIDNTEFVTIDEAHRSSKNANTYIRVMDTFPHAKILGVTATPYTLNKKGFTEQYDELITGCSISHLQKLGFLLKEKTYIVSLSGEDLKSISKVGGDYSAQELTEAFVKGKIQCDYVGAYKEHANGCKAVIFATSVIHSKKIVEMFNEAGIYAVHIDGKTPKAEREKILSAHKRGDFPILCNVDVLTEGYDDPTIECVLLARPTKSLAIAIQQRGRGLRPYPKEHPDRLGKTGVTKDKCIIIDCANIYVEHGAQIREIDWHEHFKGVKKKRKFKRVLFDEKTGRLFMPENVPYNADLSIFELDGSERFEAIRKAIKHKNRYSMDGFAARQFVYNCLSEGSHYPTKKEYFLLAALTGSTRKQALNWYRNLNKDLYYG